MELNTNMLGFENTYTIEKQIRDVPRLTVRQEVRVIDGSLFITHWHTDKEYWSYDQLSKELINTYDFSDLKRRLLKDIWDNLEDIVLAINTLNIERGCVDELKVGELLIKNR